MSTTLHIHQIILKQNKNKGNKKSAVDSKEKHHLTWWEFDACRTTLKCNHSELKALKREIERLSEPPKNSNTILVYEMSVFTKYQQEEWNVTPDFIRRCYALIETLNNKGS